MPNQIYGWRTAVATPQEEQPKDDDDNDDTIDPISN